MSDIAYISEYKGNQTHHTFCGGSNRECVKAIKDSYKRYNKDIDLKEVKITRAE